MLGLARQNLFYDKVRLAVTLTGIGFAVVLIAVELGLFVGFSQTTTCLIDHSNADLWMTASGVPYIELGALFDQRKLYQARATPGVAEAQKYIVTGARWKRLDGVQQSVQLVGFNPASILGRPWDVVEGDVRDLYNRDGVMIDEFYKSKLGVTRIGDVFEINGNRVRVVGFTRGIRAFTTSPYVFTRFSRALEMTKLPANQTSYVLIRAKKNTDVNFLRNDLSAHLKDVDVLTNEKFSQLTERYWTFTTGAGMAVLLAAVLGLVVGFVVVAQTIYATTMDHLKEFGTLKAIGASNRYLCKVILLQALIAATIGFGIGIAGASLIVRYAQPAGAPILLNSWLDGGMFVLTLMMCSGAALISINKVTRLDPALVFRG